MTHLQRHQPRQLQQLQMQIRHLHQLRQHLPIRQQLHHLQCLVRLHQWMKSLVPCKRKSTVLPPNRLLHQLPSQLPLHLPNQLPHQPRPLIRLHQLQLLTQS
jgi:hypothetical protein